MPTHVVCGVNNKHLYTYMCVCLHCRALNGFLNTGNGGTVYLGVTDDGVVKGLYLSQAQVT